MSEPNPNTNQNQEPASQVQNTQPNGNQQPAFDYEKLASIINGKQTVTEDTVLKSYFKEQGLSPEEAKQAINAFKEQKAKNTPDVNQLQSTIDSERSARLNAEIDKTATLEAIKLGIDVNTIPYVLKLADFNEVVIDGKINADKLSESIKKVLDDVPALKGTQKNDNSGNGFQQIGGDNNQQQNVTEEMLNGIFGIKN